MVHQTHFAEPPPSLQQNRSSDKIVDVLELMPSSYDSEGWQSSYEEEVDLGKTLLISSSSSYGSESTQEQDEVVGTNSDNIGGDIVDPIDAEAVEVVSEDSEDSDSEDSEDSDEWDEFDGLESEPSLIEDDKEAAASEVTVFLLEHVIVRTDDAEAQHQEVEKESPGTNECQKKIRSFRHFRRHKSEPSTSIQEKKRRFSSRRPLVSVLLMKRSKEKYLAEFSNSLHFDSREDTEENTDTALKTSKCPPQEKSHRGSQHVLASAITMKTSREQEDVESSSSNNYESTEGTVAFTEDSDYLASIDPSRCQKNAEWSKLANPALSRVDSDLSGGSPDHYPESLKSSRSASSRRSVRLFNMFKRKQRGNSKSVKIKGEGEEDEGTTKTAKTNRSWFPRRKRKKTPTGEITLKSKRSFSLFRKPSWGRRNQIATLDKPQELTQEPPTPEQPSLWETFFEGCDKICCGALYNHGDAEDLASIHSDKSEAPSEIFVHLDSSLSKSLYTI